MKTRKAIFAGSWYPDSARDCEKEIKAFLKEPGFQTPLKKKLNGGIVPHAGWYFSGSIACNVISCLVEDKPPDVIVIFGMHLHSGSDRYLMVEGAWETPFGEIQIENKLAIELNEKFDFHLETCNDFIQDNTIELQLPFIKYFFRDVKIVPVGVPPDKSSFEVGKEVARISRELGLALKVVGSTDLTHYGLNYGFMPKGSGLDAVEWVRNENDRKFIESVLSMNPERIIQEAMNNQNACCSGAAAATVAAAKELGSEHAEMIAYATSYDRRPDDSFVGYAGLVF